MEKPSGSYDLLVIGGGSAGHAAARTARSLGLKTALVESAEILGGLCILRGCMPSKALIETANRMRVIRDAARFGIKSAPPELDIDALRARLEELIGGFRRDREGEMTSGPYELLRGAARFSSPHEVELTTASGVSTLGAKTFVIATGAHPSIPPIPGLKGTPFWTSDDVVQRPALPARIAIVGAGAVGMECAHLFEGLGSRVTVIARGPTIMSGYDEDLAAALEAESRERGISFLKDTEVSSVSHHDGVFRLTLEGAASSLEAEALLIATGRRPSTSGLGLQAIGIATEKARIVIDQRCVSSLSHIFAAGDCASPVPVVHLAIIQGEVAARNAAHLIRHNHLEAPAEWNRESAMTAWFTEPQCVQIGLSESAAKETGINFLSARQDYSSQGKGKIAGSRHGFVKVLADPATGRLLGASGVGPQVVETSHLLQTAIELGLSASAFLGIPRYHPTLAEAWSRAVEGIEAKRASP